MGSFLVDYVNTDTLQGKVEKVDSPHWYSHDIRQETCCDVLTELRKRGITPTDENFVSMTNMLGPLVAKMHRCNFQSAKRGIRGRGATIKPREVPLDEAFTVAFLDNFEALEEDFGQELREIWDHGTETERKAIKLLTIWYQRKMNGESCYDLRKPLYKLKQKLKKEGSAFKIRADFL
jgi:hypothetical protein